jgi:hypothetical protein
MAYRPLSSSVTRLGAAFLVILFFSLLVFSVIEIRFLYKQPLVFLLTDINQGNSVKAWIYERGIYYLRGEKKEISDLNDARVRQIETSRQVIFASVIIKDKDLAKRMLEFFLSRGLNINSRNGLMDDGSALFDAIGQMDDQAVELLLIHGIDPHIVCSTSNFKGLTALALAEVFQKKFPDRNYKKITQLLEIASKELIRAKPIQPSL